MAEWTREPPRRNEGCVRAAGELLIARTPPAAMAMETARQGRVDLTVRNGPALGARASSHGEIRAQRSDASGAPMGGSAR